MIWAFFTHIFRTEISNKQNDGNVINRKWTILFSKCKEEHSLKHSINIRCMNIWLTFSLIESKLSQQRNIHKNIPLESYKILICSMHKCEKNAFCFAIFTKLKQKKKQKRKKTACITSCTSHLVESWINFVALMKLPMSFSLIVSDCDDNCWWKEDGMEAPSIWNAVLNRVILGSPLENIFELDHAQNYNGSANKKFIAKTRDRSDRYEPLR